MSGNAIYTFEFQFPQLGSASFSLLYFLFVHLYSYNAQLSLGYIGDLEFEFGLLVMSAFYEQTWAFFDFFSI